MALMKPTWQNQIKTSCRIKCVYCMVLLNRGCCCCCRCTTEGLHEGFMRATVKAHGRRAGPKLLIGIILTSCNYSPEICSYCSGFNEQAITQPTIIITRTIKRDDYSLVKRSHMWRPRILLRTLADRRTQTQTALADSWARQTEKVSALCLVSPFDRASSLNVQRRQGTLLWVTTVT